MKARTFLKNLLWQPQWIPLLIAMIIGFVAGVMLEDSEGAEFSYTGEKWAKPYRYAISDSCPSFVGHLYGLALNDMSPVPHERLPNTHKQRFSIDDESIVYCSDEQPVASLREPDGLTVRTEHVTASDGAVIGQAQWAYADDGEITQCDVWFDSGKLMTDVVISGQEYTGQISEGLMRTLAAHEAGHCFGMRHVSDRDAVMYGHVGYAKAWHVLDQAQMALIYDGCHAVVHESGSMFVPSADVDRLVRGTEWSEWEGARVSYLINAGAEWPLGVYGVGESVC